MNTPSPLPQDVWERTPAEAQAYIRALEARIAALEATVQRLLERLRMDSQNSSQPPPAVRAQPLCVSDYHRPARPAQLENRDHNCRARTPPGRRGEPDLWRPCLSAFCRH